MVEYWDLLIAYRITRYMDGDENVYYEVSK
jgi:hypothetical protein